MIGSAEGGQAWGSEGKSKGEVGALRILSPGDYGIITRGRKQRQK